VNVLKPGKHRAKRSAERKLAGLQLSFYVVAILSCLSSNLLAQMTAPVTVAGVGPEGGIVYSIVVDPSDSNTLYSVSETGVFKSTDRGATWSYSGLAGTYVTTIAIVPQSPATVYSAARGNIFKSLDAGANWSWILGTPPNLNLDAVDPQGTLFGRIQPIGGLFKSSDGGTTWQQAGVGILSAMLGPVAIDPRSANTLYIAGHPINVDFPGVTLFKSTNGGTSWSPIASGISLSAGLGVTVDPINTSTLYMTTEMGFIKSTDAGRSWKAINNGLPECFCTFRPVVIDPQRSDTLYAIRFDGAIFKSTNGGQNWALNSRFAADSLTVDPRDSNTLYAPAFGSPSFGVGAFKSTDGGVSWSGINTDLRATPIVSAVIDPRNPETLYAGTPRRGFLKSIDKGKTWAAINSGIKQQDELPDVEPLAIDPQTPSTLYGGIGGYQCDPGGVFKSVDGGLNWADSGLVTCINALIIDPQIPSTIYALDAYGGAFKSVDGGRSWNPINAGLPKGSVTDLAIDRQNSQTLYAAVGKAVYKSTDGGAIWNYSTDLNGAIAKVATDGQHPGTVYVIITPSAGGGIWKSVDGGTSWQDLSSALPATPYTIALDPKNSATIYAATDYGVITSADGGKSWTLLTAAIGTGIQRLIPGTDSTLYASGPAGLFAISSATVSAVTFDIGLVHNGGSYTATVVGSNLNDNTYFDVLVRAPGSTVEFVALNWQMGTSESHSVPVGMMSGTWTIDGVRAHQDPENHSGSFAQVSATITVSP
jgi:photosystem II stability/assembly factor-like uncharacterized protein